LNMSFKLMALAPQISVTDATGKLVCFVKQKLFKLKESVTVFADAEKTKPLATIGADRVLDISALYRFTSAADQRPLGAVKRRGLKSIWKCHYEILDGDQTVMTIQEDNPWVKVADALFMNIPILGMFAGYVFHPSYTVSRNDGQAVLQLKKMPAFLEGKFQMEKLGELTPEEEARVLFSLVMMILLERARG
jgi:uncharacterized protein YxjI